MFGKVFLTGLKHFGAGVAGIPVNIIITLHGLQKLQRCYSFRIRKNNVVDDDDVSS